MIALTYHQRMARLALRMLFAAAATLALVLVHSPAAAKPDYTRRTGKACVFCHPGPGWTLNEAGKYYRDHGHSLKGYEPKPAPPVT